MLCVLIRLVAVTERLPVLAFDSATTVAEPSEIVRQTNKMVRLLPSAPSPGFSHLLPVWHLSLSLPNRALIIVFISDLILFLKGLRSRSSPVACTTSRFACFSRPR